MSTMPSNPPASPQDPILTSSLQSESSLHLQRDPVSRVNTPPTDSLHQKIPEVSEAPGCSSSDAQKVKATGSISGKESDGSGARHDEQVHALSPEHQLDPHNVPNSPTPSIHAQSTNALATDGSNNVDIQRQILNVLTKMYEKMEGQQDEVPIHSTGTGSGTHQHTGPFKQTLLGTTKQRFDQGQQFNPGNEDYEQIFPEDAYGDETGPNARVFMVYNEEATAYDIDMIGQASDSSDVLLVFAGLFSAVLTTFVAQTSQELETDNGAVSNFLLLEIVQLLRAQANGTSLESVEHAVMDTEPSVHDVWVNGLWFTSLTLSLATALFAVLTKQWLRQYMVRTSGTIRHRSVVRQFRFAGMEKWHVIGIIGVLPIMLHLSLGVFLVGLIIFLIPRCLILAYIVGCMTFIIYSLYFISNLLPVFDIQCPYRTPFSEVLNILFCLVKSILHLNTHSGAPSLRKEEEDHVQQVLITSSLSLDVIIWLMDKSSNPSVHSVAVQAIGGLSPSQIARKNEIPESCWDFLPNLVNECLIDSPEISRVERFARTYPLIIQHLESKYVVGTEFIDKFREENYIIGMVSAFACKPSPEIVILFNYLLHHFPDIELAPYAWINLLWSMRFCGSLEDLDRTSVCVQALKNSDGWKVLSWDHDMALVPLSVILSRMPDLFLPIFRDYNHASSLLSSPLGMRLSALLALHHYLEETISQSSATDTGLPSDVNASIQLLCTVWETMQLIFDTHQAQVTVDDCTILHHTATDWFVRSPLLMGHEWKASDNLSKYCKSLLKSRFVSIDCSQERFGSQVARSIQKNLTWEFFERVIDIQFPVNNTVVLCDRFPTLDMEASRHWRGALENGVENAYNVFLSVDVLGQHRHLGESSVYGIVSSFLSGLSLHTATRWSLRRESECRWRQDCLTYLHDPNNLFTACRLLAEYNRYSPLKEFMTLVRLDPDNTAWITCLERLRQWQSQREEPTGYFEKIQEAAMRNTLKAVIQFFERRHQRKEFTQRMNLMRVFRKNNRSTDPDVEQQPVTGRIVSGTADPLFTSQEVISHQVGASDLRLPPSISDVAQVQTGTSVLDSDAAIIKPADPAPFTTEQIDSEGHPMFPNIEVTAENLTPESTVPDQPADTHIRFQDVDGVQPEESTSVEITGGALPSDVGLSSRT